MKPYQRLVVVFSPNSTRAKIYNKLRPNITDYSLTLDVGITEIRLKNTPYFEARKTIADSLVDGDLVVACGGDGTAQVTFDAIYCSGAKATFAVIPLGNSNDLSLALNGKHTNPHTILRQSAAVLRPINLYADGERQFSIASYVTFGATTVLVDYLNQKVGRTRRRIFKRLTPALSLPLSKMSEISHKVNNLEFPDFERDHNIMQDDSIGFFNINAAHNVLRLSKRVIFAETEFFFHHAMTKNKNLAKKIIMAGLWTINFPGEFSSLETLNFRQPVELIANVAGDNINIGMTKKIAALRSERGIQVLTSQ